MPADSTPSPTAKNHPAPPLPWNVYLLGWASFLNDTASEMLAPLLPKFFIAVLGGTKEMLGLIDGFGETVASILKLWSGAQSDRAGKRKGFVVFGYALAAVARPLIGLATAPWQVFGLRALDRIGKGIRTAPRDAILAESADDSNRGRAFGFHRAMDHAGTIAGASLALLLVWIWPNNLGRIFMLAILPALPIMWLVALGLREPERKLTGQSPPFTLTLAPFDGNFRYYLITLFVFTLANSSDSFLLVRADELGVPDWQKPILWAALHVVKGSGNLIGGRWVDRFGPRPLIWAGWLLYAAVYLAFAFAWAQWHVWALFIIYGVFYALTEPAEKTWVVQLVGAERKGLAFGWFNLTLGVGALPASALFGLIYQRVGPAAAFGLSAALALIATFMLAGVRAKATPASAAKPA